MIRALHLAHQSVDELLVLPLFPLLILPLLILPLLIPLPLLFPLLPLIQLRAARLGRQSVLLRVRHHGLRQEGRRVAGRVGSVCERIRVGAGLGRG